MPRCESKYSLILFSETSSTACSDTVERYWSTISPFRYASTILSILSGSGMFFSATSRRTRSRTQWPTILSNMFALSAGLRPAGILRNTSATVSAESPTDTSTSSDCCMSAGCDPHETIGTTNHAAKSAAM